MDMSILKQVKSIIQNSSSSGITINSMINSPLHTYLNSLNQQDLIYLNILAETVRYVCTMSKNPTDISQQIGFIIRDCSNKNKSDLVTDIDSLRIYF